MKVEDKILNFLKVSGPSLPIRVAKNIKEDGLITSAFLSDLASQRKVKISKLKIGSSPLYYLPGHEAQLMDHIDGINLKDLNVLKRLQNEKIIREKDQELLTKVALRNLKDFAIPLHVTSKIGKEIFWKYYLLSDEETNNIISLLLGPKPSEKEEPEPITQAQEEIAKHVVEKSEHKPENIAPIQTQEEQVPVPNEDQSYPPNTTVSEAQETLQVYPPVTAEIISEKHEKIEIKEELPTEKPTEVENVGPVVEEKEVQKETETGKEVKKEQIHVTKEDTTKELPKEEQKPTGPSKPKKVEKQKSLVTKLKEKIVGKKRSPVEDTFMPIIQSFFEELNINIIEHEVVRKNSEVDFSLKVPSVVGRLNYYCKARNKNKCDEKDISTAYMQAQITKRPLLFLYTGSLTKKAVEMLGSGAFENAVVKKLE